MDQELMAKALQQVLGAGYESRSRMSAQGSAQQPLPKSPSPRDAIGQWATTPDDLVAKSNPSGGDLHVPTTMGADKPKKRARLKPVEYVTEVSKVKKPTEEQVAHGLLTAGAAGGLLSLPSLAGHTRSKLKEAKGPLPGPTGTLRDIPKAKGVLRAVKNPKVGAGLAMGAAGLELAGLGGDFLGRKVTAKPKQPKTGVYKALDRVQDEGELLMETISKADDEKMQVFGWCSISKKDGVDVVDLQGDMIPIEEIETAAYSYMLNSRKGGNQHQRVNKGFVEDEPLHVSDIIESVVFTPEKIEKMGLPADFPQGWWIGQQIHDKETWHQVKTGQRKGFSIHGKGRREPVDEVAKAAQPKKVDVVYETDRKAAVRDAALGGAGATAAGAGVTAAGLPIAAKKGLIGAEKAEHLGGRFKTVGAIVGGTAGVYGGLHTAHQAAKPQLKAISTKVTVKKPVKKAWSPEARQASIESRRNKRAKTYEATTATGAVTAAGASAGAHLVARRSATQQSQAKARAEAVKVPNNLDARLKGSRGLRNANDRYNAGKGQPVNPKKRAESAARAESKIRAKFAEESRGARQTKAVHEAAAAKAGGRLRLARRVRGRGGAAALGLGVLTGAIHRERKGSWRSYPGVH